MTSPVPQEAEMPAEIIIAADNALYDILREPSQSQARARLIIAKAILAERERDRWETMETAPYACHVLASYFDEEVGEWICDVIMSPPSDRWRFWMPLPDVPSRSPSPTIIHRHSEINLTPFEDAGSGE